MSCICKEDEIKLEEFFRSIYLENEYSKNIKDIIIKIMMYVFTNDEAKVIKNLGLEGAKELECFFPNISEYAKATCFRIAIFATLKIPYHCPKCLNEVFSDGTIKSGKPHEKEVDYTPYHQTEEGNVRFNEVFSKFNRKDLAGIVICKIVSVMNINPLFFEYFGLTFNEYFQLLKFINIYNVEDISDYSQKAIKFLEQDLSNHENIINQQIHKILIKKLMTHYCNAHPYERMGFSNRGELRKLIKELYPTWYEAIEKDSSGRCLRRVLGDIIGVSISCNHCGIV